MLLNEIGAYLVANGIGVLGTDLFKGPMPATPNKCVSILDYGGAAPDTVLGAAGDTQENPRFQLLSRDTTLVGARAKAQEAFVALGKVKNMTLSGTRYLAIRPIQSPFFLMQDANNRIVYAVNFECQRMLV